MVTANRHIYAEMSYDPEKDLVPVTMAVSGPQVLSVPAKSLFKTVEDLISYGQVGRERAQATHRRCCIDSGRRLK